MLAKSTFHHIGYAVVSIQQTARYYTEAGFSLSQTTLDPVQNVKVAFLSKNGFPTIELVEGVNESSPTVAILQKSGVSPYHICYQVESIESAINELRQQKFIPLFKPVAAAAFNGKLICYLFNKDVGLIELLEF